MKAISQPHALAMKGMVIGAASAPIVDPELNMLVEKALSFFGKYSAVAFMAAGKFPASPTASTSRARTKRATLTLTTLDTSETAAMASLAPSKPTNHFPAVIPEVAIPQNACRQAPKDQMPIAHR